MDELIVKGSAENQDCISVSVARLLQLLSTRPKEFVVVGNGVFIDLGSRKAQPLVCCDGPLPIATAEPPTVPPALGEGACEGPLQNEPLVFPGKGGSGSTGACSSSTEAWRTAGGKGATPWERAVIRQQFSATLYEKEVAQRHFPPQEEKEEAAEDDEVSSCHLSAAAEEPAEEGKAKAVRDSKAKRERRKAARLLIAAAEKADNLLLEAAAAQAEEEATALTAAELAEAEAQEVDGEHEAQLLAGYLQPVCSELSVEAKPDASGLLLFKVSVPISLVEALGALANVIQSYLDGSYGSGAAAFEVCLCEGGVPVHLKNPG